MSTAKEVALALKKKFGEQIGGQGAKFPAVDRVPTGFFSIDLTTGGGIPRGCVTIIFGPEGCGKTTLALKTIAEYQKRWPEDTCALFDIENQFDPAWAAVLGVDVDKLHVYKPDYAEQAVDMIETFLYADDCGMVIIDSLAALVTVKEVEESAEKDLPGAQARVVKKLVLKTNTAMTVQRKSGRMPTLIYINQIRYQIGVMYGNPEKMPGGMAPKYQSSMTMRLWGKRLMDKSVSAIMPARLKIDCVLQKWRVKVLGNAAQAEMIMVPHKGLEVGQVDDWKVVEGYLREYGYLGKGGKKGWVMFEQEYDTLGDCREALVSDPASMDQARGMILDAMFKDDGKSLTS